MTILKPSQEQLVQEALRSGRYQNVDEFLDEALSAWKHNETEGFDLQKAQAAAVSIRELRQGVTLGGLKIKDLVAEGRA
jgi:Arc/MetJ-type ribon-helix-helix transcriptional regulator